MLVIDAAGPVPPGLALAPDVADWLADRIEGLPPEARKAGAITELQPRADRIDSILLLGFGSFSATDVRLAGAALGRRGEAELASSLPELELEAAFAEGVRLGRYTFVPTARAPRRAPGRPRTRQVGSPGQELGRLRAAGTEWARDLANEPAGVKNPAWLAAQAERVLAPLGVAVTVHDESWLATAGFGGTLAVGGGSASPPRFVEASWRPRGTARMPHIVLVGKGITFDTGGLNIKPGDAMTLMHTDMSGSAAVFGAMRIIAALGVRARVTALAPMAENAVSGSSMRPSDVVRHPNGRTSEVGNTDAEGRLVLADALSYAVAALDPAVLVDIATLTGAMKVALGLQTGGLLATTDELAADLLAAGEATGEPLWRMPLQEREYGPLINSSIADGTNNAGNPGGITAALFLQPFTGGLPWAHLDIAGPARAPKDTPLARKGATGFGARLLAEWVQRQTR